MSIFPNPDRSGLATLDPHACKKAADTESIRGYARFLEGLASLEEIDADAWFVGSRVEAYPYLEAAATLFDEAREKFVHATTKCSQYQEWLPADRRGELTPDLDMFRQMVHILGDIVATLRDRELPTLRQIHAADELMRTEMIIAERRAVAMRGTPGHFPVAAL